MTFDAREISNAGGTPVRLYEFRRTDNLGTRYWRYCSAQEDLLIGSDVWSAVTISDEGTQITGEVVTQEVTILMDAELEVIRLFRGTPPSGRIYVRLWDIHAEEPTDRRLAFIGTLGSVKRKTPIQAQVTVNSLLGSLRRRGVRKMWSRGCSNILYDSDCTLNPNDWSQIRPITAVNGLQITFAGLAASVPGWETVWFGGGYLEYADVNGLLQRRPIRYQDNDVLTMLGPTDGLVAGMSVKLVGGCRYSKYDCINKFNNYANYGGAPDQPGVSPFDGAVIF